MFCKITLGQVKERERPEKEGKMQRRVQEFSVLLSLGTLHVSFHLLLTLTVSIKQCLNFNSKTNEVPESLSNSLDNEQI